MVISRTSPEWNELEFGAICDVQNGYAFKSENFISHGIPIIKIANIQDGKVIIDEASSYPEISISDNFLVNTGDILLAMSGATTGKVGVYTGKRRLYLNQRVCKMVCKGSLKTYYPYVKYLLSSNLFVKQLESSLTAGAQPNLSPKQVRKMVFKIPSYEEQKAIATALSDIDELIANLEKLIEKKNAIKQGTMQELLTGKRRLPGFSGDVKYQPLSSLCEVFTDGDWIESKDQSNDGIRLIQTGNVGVGKYLDKSDKQRFISEDTFSRLNCMEIFENDVIVSRLPEPAGRACVLPFSSKRRITAVDCTVIRFSNYNPVLFVAYTQISEYQSKVGMTLAGSTRQRISRKELGSIPIPVFPTKEEQDAIASIIIDVDGEIDKLGMKLSKYRQIKQGMMQKLLTGEIRLV